MELQSLPAEKRSGLGKGAARKLRAAGRIPAVCYGLGKEPVSVTVEPRALLKLLRGPLGRNSICQLAVAGEDAPRMVCLKDIQVHPVKRKLVHVDFLEVQEDSRLVIDVPVKLQGTSVGVKAGGELHWVLKEMKVACAPLNVPRFIHVDISALGIGDVLYAEALALPDGVEAMTKSRVPVLTVKSGRGAEAEEGEEGEEGEEKAEAEDATAAKAD